MKKLLILLLTGIFLAGSVPFAQASDWDKAGKALTIIEGLRLFTGGHIDVVGKIGEVATGRTYTNKDKNNNHGVFYKGHYKKHKHHKHHNRVVKRYTCTEEKFWVPKFHWVKKHIPEHTEYDEDYGEIIVESHYIKIKKEAGGYWDTKETCEDIYTY